VRRCPRWSSISFGEWLDDEHQLVVFGQRPSACALFAYSVVVTLGTE